MMQQHRSARAAAPSASEYETNWKVMCGVAGIAVLLVLCGLAALFWPDTSDRNPSPVASDASTTEPTMRPAAPHRLTFRREVSFVEPAPQLDIQVVGTAPSKIPIVVRHGATACGQALADWLGTSIVPAYELLPPAVPPRSPPLPPPEPQQSVAFHDWDQRRSPRLEARVYSRPRRGNAFEQPEAKEDQVKENPKPSNQELLAEYLDNRVPVLDVGENATGSFIQYTKDNRNQSFDPQVRKLEELIAERRDFRGLPLLLGGDCTSEKSTAIHRQKLAMGLRRTLRIGSESDLDIQYLINRKEYGGDHDKFISWLMWRTKLEDVWQQPDQVAILEQLFQAESKLSRLLLIKMLDRIEGPEASQALARRAIFDFDEEVRTAARARLATREVCEYEEVLSRGLNYPFAPVARHSQRALEELKLGAKPTEQEQPNEQEVSSSLNSKSPNVPASASSLTAKPAQKEQQEHEDLASLLADSSHVSPPYVRDQTWVVDELVKVNHLRNCVLCHAVSHDRHEPLRGQIPTPGRRLPQVYYNSQEGNFIRADIVYLRQDFSVMLPVENAHPWPQMQRFDFFVRTRPAALSEIAEYDLRQKRTWGERRWQAQMALSRWWSEVKQRTSTIARAWAEERVAR